METCEYCGTNPANDPWTKKANVCTDCRPEHDKMKKHAERAQKLGLPHMRFSFTEILERDGAFCSDCWKVCTTVYDKTPGAHNPDYATLDHVIPLKFDTEHHPGHVPPNCRIVCFDCNSKRSNKVDPSTVHCCKPHRDTGVHSKRCHAA